VFARAAELALALLQPEHLGEQRQQLTEVLTPTTSAEWFVIRQ
jgi:hypothetical protein